MKRALSGLSGYTSVGLLSLLVLSAGCSSTREIETSAPRSPAAVASEAQESDPQNARLTVILEPGGSMLPADVHELHFRIAEVRLRGVNEGWTRLSSEMQRVELRRTSRGTSRTIIDTRLPPAEYDSVAVSFDQVFVRFNANSGAPLAVADDAPLTFPLSVRSTVDAPTTLRLQLMPEASLVRSRDCRWFFIPVVEADAEPQ